MVICGTMEEIEDYNEWVQEHEDDILNAYIEQLDLDQVPDDYIQDYYESRMLGDE